MPITVFEAFYLFIIACLCIYGVHRYWLVWQSRRPATVPDVIAVDPSSAPKVLIQLPIFNESVDHVVRLIDSALAVEWPGDHLQVQVLDDSNDGSEDLVRSAVEARRSAGHDIEHIQRTDRTGYKAGALAYGLERNDAEFVAIFDADFVIVTDFLTRTVPCFANERMGMVQARWGFMNEDANLLTRVQAVMLDGHFRIDHRVRSQCGRFFNFNGTAGIWRRATIEDAGGWGFDNITEDLDLSLRAWARGWKFHYLDDLAVPSELPEDMPSYKVQQNRWVSGSVETACTYLPKILRSKARLSERLDLVFYLTGNLTYLLLLCLALSILPAILLRLDSSRHWLLWSDVPFMMLATLSVFVYCGRVRGRRPALGYFLFRLPALMALGLGMTLHNTRAICKGVLGRAKVFERTPKSVENRPAKRRRDAIPWFEAGMVCYTSACVWLSLMGGSVAGLPFLALFAGGFLYVFARGRLQT